MTKSYENLILCSGQKIVNLPNSKASSSEENSTKFGNSMREMLKNVVSSQKNVLYKKVDSLEQQTTSTPQPVQTPQQKTKMGKFFQTLSLKNSLSKSNQSLEKSKSKDSIVSSADSDIVNKQLTEENRQRRPVLTDKKDKKQRSKSLSTENRLSSNKRDNSSNRSELGSSSTAGKQTNEKSKQTADSKQSTSGAGRAEGQVKTQTRWLGKNPFDTSPATEVNSNQQLNPFMPNYNELFGEISGISQNDSTTAGSLAGTGSDGTQGWPKKEGSTLGKADFRLENSQNLLESQKDSNDTSTNNILPK